MATKHFAMDLRKIIPIILIAFVVVAIQTPVQSAREGEKERLKNVEFKRAYSDHFRQVAEALRPCVVAVESRYTKSIKDINGDVRDIYEEGNYGSGFIFDREGHVFTDLRNVLQYPSGFISPLNPRQQSSKHGDYIKVTLYNGESFEADFVGLDSVTGLAVLKMKRINPDALQPVVFSDVMKVAIGEPVMILDYNFYNKNLLGGAFGVIAATRGQFASLEESENEFYMINFPKMGGNDGGIIIDVYGHVIAMVSSYTPYQETSELHYGIPTDLLKKAGSHIINFGVYDRPWYGFTLLELNDTLKLQEDIDFDEGLYIAYVEPDSPAEKSGLSKGDVLYKWDGEVVENLQVISNVFEKRKIGESIPIEYFHRDFNVWDSYNGTYKLEIQETSETDEMEKARERARKYL